MIPFTDYMVPSNPFMPYLLEDIHVKGGFRAVLTLSQRDEIVPFVKKSGMIVYVEEDDTYYKWVHANNAFEPWNSGGGFGEDEIASPLTIVDGKLTVDTAFLLPEGGLVGQVPMMKENGVEWAHLTQNINRGVRAVKVYAVPLMQPGDEHRFDLELGRTIMIIKSEVNAHDIEIKGFGTPERNDRNPYTFISGIDYFVDEGIKFGENNEADYMRRHAFVANREIPVQDTVYFTARNIGGAPASVVLTIEYMVVE